jgi:hypothetical protein
MTSVVLLALEDDLEVFWKVKKEGMEVPAEESLEKVEWDGS